MRSVGVIGTIGLVVGLAVPSFAAEKNAPELFAISQVATSGTLQAMSDKQLTAVEGMSYKAHHGYGGHYGPINQDNYLSQFNLNEGCGCKHRHGGEVYQQNGAEQVNNVHGHHGRIDQSNWADQANVNFGGHFVDQSNGAYQANNIH